MEIKKTNIKTTHFLPLSHAVSLWTSLPAPCPEQCRRDREWEGYSQSIIVLLCSPSSSLFSSALAWASPLPAVGKICSSTGSPQVTVPSGISICLDVYLSAGCREDLLCCGEPPPPFSEHDVPSFLTLFVPFSSLLVVLPALCKNKFSVRCCILYRWAQLWEPARAVWNCHVRP